MSDQDIKIESDIEVEQEKEKPARKKPGPKPKGEKGEVPIPTIGRIVQYVTASKTVRPAIIVGLSGGTSVEVVVFNSAVGAQFMPNVAHDPEGKTPGTYHWHHES